MKKTILLVIILLMSVMPCTADEKTIVAAADPWPPFVDPAAPKEGLSLEIVRASYETQGYSVKMEYVPWARAIDGVKKGKYDILPNTWMNEQRKAFLMYSEPYAVNEVKFIKTADDPFEFNGLESLTGKKVGIVRGYGYGDDFTNATNFVREDSNDFITNIKKLTHSSKRVDLAIEDEIVARVIIAKEDPALLEKIKFTENAISTSPLYVTCGLANPRHKELIDAFNKGLAIIKENGKYGIILENYGIK
ncbi:ABC-type amino acid transport/signal transduction systems, periplasmic component/domain [Desulfamplus magnetovallimortis]|uniref:ABC-type amino acid transport/signal transduction systems, periplasmic component/domain n=1 Tax=Desulfamplus magnetovallimortis TaxID=1246637 RepID=A0A1W1HIN5_9BACT|nr:transporter substrate-binding domain-containing protein [Desulfamplus magnetovallimortis]SLM32339.1 ABC-type amino acid transport/signal transduction systems, periplasmic component/domain [Desulfamplus magnetovallimortis]